MKCSEEMKQVHKRVYDIPDFVLEKKPLYSFFKRFFDIALSLIAIAVCIIPMLIIAVTVKCDSKGPAIYKQERLGKDGKKFLLYKFRSMRENAEEDGAKWAEENDARCTRVGRFLRASRLDELPQFFNILGGSMSLVGPRPERKVFYDLFEENIHGFAHRLKVKPGLTGHAQVNGGYDLLPEEKIVYDIEYIKNRSFKFDAMCLIKTVAVIFNHNGAR